MTKSFVSDIPTYTMTKRREESTNGGLSWPTKNLIIVFAIIRRHHENGMHLMNLEEEDLAECDGGDSSKKAVSMP